MREREREREREKKSYKGEMAGKGYTMRADDTRVKNRTYTQRNCDGPWMVGRRSNGKAVSVSGGRIEERKRVSKVRVLTGHPSLARPCERVHRRKSLMSSSLFLQQCPACFVRLIWKVFKMGGRCLNSCYFLGCCFQDLINKYSS